MNVVISSYIVWSRFLILSIYLFISFLQGTLELNYKFCSYKFKGTTLNISVITIFVILNYIKYFLLELFVIYFLVNFQDSNYCSKISPITLF